MSRTLRSILLPTLAALASCGDSTPTEPEPPKQEICNNLKDDNGNGKIDCFDPECFSSPLCQVTFEDCANGPDDNGDGLADCEDPSCEGSVCGEDCICRNGVPVRGGSGGGEGTGGGDEGTGGGTAGTGGGTAGTGGGTAGTGGGTAGTGGGTAGTGGGTAGTGGGTAGTGGGTAGTGGGTAGTGGGTSAACPGCGAGCTCTNGTAKEVACSDGLDNDGDGLSDCADPDCVGAGVEICGDGIDNNCDRAIDCGDAQCVGNAACANLADGKPCLQDSQCAGGDCLDEASTGMPNGMCSNATSCTVGTNAGCNGGVCFQGTSFNSCVAKCTGTGIGSTGACRPGYACYDPDDSTTNNNNGCLPLCTSNTECSGGGSGYGCNAWSKRCGNLDRGLGKYGAACTSGSNCESGQCLTGTTSPGGYCTGPCRGDLSNCGPSGYCYLNSIYGDNYGMCYQACGTSAECRTSSNYKCWNTTVPQEPSLCLCLAANDSCSSNSDCCSGSCWLGICD